MKVSEWCYDPTTDWYIRYHTYLKEGQEYAYEERANWYWGESRIPKIERTRR